MTPTDSRSLLSRNPVFRNFLCASVVSLLGSSIFDIAMPLYVLGRTHSAFALSLVHIGLTLPFFLMAPFTGYSADYLNKRRVMLFSDTGQVVCLTFLILYETVSADGRRSINRQYLVPFRPASDSNFWPYSRRNSHVRRRGKSVHYYQPG
jgi:hypothetical protein